MVVAAVLAVGEGDVLLRLISKSRPDYRERIWDQAAGSIVVEEAGGRCTAFSGKPLEDGGSVVATNGALHDEVVALLGAGG